MQFQRPVVSDITVAEAHANGTMLTLDANRYYTADVVITATQSVLGTNTATLTWNPASGSSGANPAASQVLAECVVSAGTAGVSSNSAPTEILIYTGSTGGTLVFATGGTTAANCTINGAYT